MTRLANDLDLSELMRRLAEDRAVFHSEADFQFAMAWTAKQLSPTLTIRLEVPQGGREHLDLLVSGPDTTTAIELKYFTSAWTGQDPRSDESFALKSHSADDLLRLHFVHDVTRLERFVARPSYRGNGTAIVLSNHSALWTPPSLSRRTRDAAFRLHEGMILSEKLIWGTGDYPANDRQLLGTYELGWHDYSTLPGPRGELRWMAVEVG